jgi:hypothetical protein
MYKERNKIATCSVMGDSKLETEDEKRNCPIWESVLGFQFGVLA